LVAHIERETQTEGVQDRILRKIFGSKRDKVADEWRRMHNKELYEEDRACGTNEGQERCR